MTFIQAQHVYPNGNRPRWIVIHDMEYPETDGAARWCANYFAGPNAPPKSAHYCIDASEVIQTADENDGTWHTPGFIGNIEVNRASIGIEHAGYAAQSRAQWLDAYSHRELERSAALVREIASRHGIPIRRLTPDQIRAGEPGIAGHHDFTIATGSGTHTDPGPNFPWDDYLEMVRGSESASRSWVGPALLIGTAALAYGLFYTAEGAAVRSRLARAW